MSYNVLSVNDNFPIRVSSKIHSGKVRSVYFLTKEDSARLIQEKNYPVASDTRLAVMIISDRISAFDCIWKGENNLDGIPGKGASLNAISKFWFELFEKNNLAGNHILDEPHPLVWIVAQCNVLRIEGIARQYITGSMWREYQKGNRDICGINLPDNLQNNQRLDKLLITPSTKGTIRNIPSIPELEDVNISRKDIEDNLDVFSFKSFDDIDLYEQLLTDGFKVISDYLKTLGQIFVDTKFEFGYLKDDTGKEKLIYIDEVGTPDSSRIWDEEQYNEGKIVENSKETFRQDLLNYIEDSDILLDKTRMPERAKLAENTRLPEEIMLKTAKIYQDIAEKITNKKIVISTSPREEIIEALRSYNIIED